MAAFVSIAPVGSTTAIKNGSTCSFVPSKAAANSTRKPVIALTKGQVKMVVDEFNALNLLAENPGWITAIANAFKTLNLPEFVVQKGHPIMMGIMVPTMGVYGAYLGWKGRVDENKKEGVSDKRLHGNIMTAFWLLSFAGATGGILSTAMQAKGVGGSLHAKTTIPMLLLLTINGTSAWSGFDGSTHEEKTQGRTYHTYLGVLAMGMTLASSLAGLKLLFE